MVEKEHLVDTPVKLRAHVIRIINGRQISVPVVAQSTLDGGVTFRAINSRGVQSTLGGIEAAQVQSILGKFVNRQTARAAAAQHFIIARSRDLKKNNQSG